MREGHYQNKLLLNYFSFVPKQLIRPGVSLQMCYVFEKFWRKILSSFIFLKTCQLDSWYLRGSIQLCRDELSRLIASPNR